MEKIPHACPAQCPVSTHTFWWIPRPASLKADMTSKLRTIVLWSASFQLVYIIDLTVTGEDAEFTADVQQCTWKLKIQLYSQNKLQRICTHVIRAFLGVGMLVSGSDSKKKKRTLIGPQLWKEHNICRMSGTFWRYCVPISEILKKGFPCTHSTTQKSVTSGLLHRV